MKYQAYKILIFFIIVGVISACENSDTHMSPASANFEIVNGRLVFATEADAVQTLDALAKMTKEELTSWKDLNNKHGFTPTQDLHSLNDSDTTLSFYTPALAAILNANREYQAGDSVVWFYENYVFKIIETDVELLSKIQENPDDDQFSKFRHTFVKRWKPSASSVSGGRTSAVILDQLAQTPPFKLTNTLDFKFFWDLRKKYSGVNYQLELVNCLAYRANNGSWYLAGETVAEKRIYSAGFWPQSGWNLPWNYVSTSAASYNDNGYLVMTLLSSTQASEYRGQVYATFKGVVTGSAGTFSFVQEVQWY